MSTPKICMSSIRDNVIVYSTTDYTTTIVRRLSFYNSSVPKTNNETEFMFNRENTRR
jgi:hypothetical protein